MTQKNNQKEAEIYDHDDFNKNADQKEIMFANGFSEFFVNSQSTYCPIKSCTLFKKDCQTAWDGGDGNNISMDTASPWAITIKDNTFEGYGPDEMCIMCDNEYQKIYYDKLKITQTGRCVKKLFAKSFSVSA